MSHSNEYRRGKGQRRGSRIPWIHPVVIINGNNEVFIGHTIQLSLGGVSARITQFIEDKSIWVFICVNSHWYPLEGRIAFCRQNKQYLYPESYEVGIAFIDKNAGSKLWGLSRHSLDGNTVGDTVTRFFQSI